MPLFQIGYRRYEGRRTSHAIRWWPITRSGITIAWRSKLLRRLVFVSFLPFLYFGWVFFIIGRITDPGTDPSQPFYMIASEIFGPRLVNQLHEDPTVVRSAIWTMVFASFGTFAQMFLAGLVAAIAGPALIANDQRTRAFLIYFARPVSRFDYVIGKAGVLIALMTTVTLLPSLLLYLLSVLFSPSLDTIVQTAPVVVPVTLASLGTIIPAALLVLVLSALTRQARFATAIWFVLCVFGPISHIVLQQTRELRNNGWTFLLSLPHTARAFQLGLYDVNEKIESLAFSRDVREFAVGLTSSDSPTRAAVWLGLLSIACFLVLLRRVDAPTRI